MQPRHIASERSRRGKKSCRGSFFLILINSSLVSDAGHCSVIWSGWCCVPLHGHPVSKVFLWQTKVITTENRKGKRLQNCSLKLLPNCAEEGEYKKTGKLAWTQRAFWSLRPFLLCSWQSNPCLNHALYFRERSHCEELHLFPRLCSELERLRQTGRGSLAGGFSGAAGRDEQWELDQSLHDGESGEAGRLNNSVCVDVMHGKIPPEVTKLNAWVPLQWIREQVWGVERGKQAHPCWGAACAVVAAERLPPRCREGEGDLREPQPHYFYVQLPNYYVSAVCWKERCTAASRLGIYSD